MVLFFPCPFWWFTKCKLQLWECDIFYFFVNQYFELVIYQWIFGKICLEEKAVNFQAYILFFFLSKQRITGAMMHRWGMATSKIYRATLRPKCINYLFVENAPWETGFGTVLCKEWWERGTQEGNLVCFAGVLKGSTICCFTLSIVTELLEV